MLSPETVENTRENRTAPPNVKFVSLPPGPTLCFQRHRPVFRGAGRGWWEIRGDPACFHTKSSTFVKITGDWGMIFFSFFFLCLNLSPCGQVVVVVFLGPGRGVGRPTLKRGRSDSFLASAASVNHFDEVIHINSPVVVVIADSLQRFQNLFRDRPSIHLQQFRHLTPVHPSTL